MINLYEKKCTICNQNYQISYSGFSATVICKNREQEFFDFKKVDNIFIFRNKIIYRQNNYLKWTIDFICDISHKTLIYYYGGHEHLCYNKILSTSEIEAVLLLR